MGRPRSDLWENCIYQDSVSVVNGTDLYLFQAIHQEADVVVENIDAIRVMMDAAPSAEASIKTTNEALGFTAL